MDVVPLGPGFAAELRGVTLKDVASDDAAYAAVRAAFEEHSVLVFRRCQAVTDEIQLGFSRRFGPPEVTKVGSQGTGSHFVILSTIGPDGKVVPATTGLSLRAKANQLCIPTPRSSPCRRWHRSCRRASFPRAAERPNTSPPGLPSPGSMRPRATSCKTRLPGTITRIRESRLRRTSRAPRSAPPCRLNAANGVDQSRERPWRDLSRLARLCSRRHGSGGGEKADR